jgi:hypothetical protein
MFSYDFKRLRPFEVNLYDDHFSSHLRNALRIWQMNIGKSEGVTSPKHLSDAEQLEMYTYHSWRSATVKANIISNIIIAESFVRVSMPVNALPS